MVVWVAVSKLFPQPVPKGSQVGGIVLKRFPIR